MGDSGKTHIRILGVQTEFGQIAFLPYFLPKTKFFKTAILTSMGSMGPECVFSPRTIDLGVMTGKTGS